SDTIIYNEYGFSTTEVSALSKIIRCKIRKAFIRQKDYEGFVSVWKLKTPSETCFKGGSCFLIELKDGDINRLKELMKSGIGERTNEGFGRFVIGWQNDDLEKLFEKEEQKFNKPDSSVPETTKNIVKETIIDVLISYQQKKALKEAYSFEKLPPPSLLGKLESAIKKGTFHDQLKNLKKTAETNLERCRSSRETLLDFLNNVDLYNVTDILNQISGLKDLSKEISYDIETDSEFREKLIKIYLETFLSSLRRRAKMEGK
ncbi:MAG: hypothetical protein D6828_01090, partial [Nitrospirae bacterium]